MKSTYELTPNNDNLPSEGDLAKYKTYREQVFLKALSTILFPIYLFVGICFTIAGILSGQLAAFILVGVMAIGLCLVIYSRWCSGSPGYVRLGSFLLVAQILFAQSVAHYLLGSSQPTAAAFIVPLLASLFLLPRLLSVFFTISAIVSACGVYIFEAQGYRPLLALAGATATFTSIFLYLAIIATPIALGFYVLSQFDKTLNTTLQQAQSLNTAFSILEEKRKMGEDFSNAIKSISTEMNTTSNQQAAGSQQQASSLTQVTNFLKELSQTSQTVSQKTQELSTITRRATHSTSQLWEAAQQTLETGRTSVVAVESIIQSSERVSLLYSQLKAQLDFLREQQAKIRQIIEIIRVVSDEIHLLSLNALIEAAGAGEQGQRFMVVAGEVKSLANRAKQTSQNVAQILSAIEVSIGQATTAAISVEVETQTALQTAQNTGQVIIRLADDIGHNVAELENIDEALTTVSEQTDEISYSTHQQCTASNEAVRSLQDIEQVAFQAANASIQLSKNAHTLENMSRSLVQALAN